MNIIKEKRISIVLFLSIIIMYIPIFLSVKVFNNFSYRIPMYSVTFALQLLLLLWALNGINAKTSIKSLLLVLVYAIISILPLLKNSITNIDTHYYDYLNIIIKAVNIFVFYGLFKNVSLSRETIIIFFELIIKFSIAACIYSFVVEFNKIISIPGISNTNLININSFFANRNQFASFLLLGILSNLFIIVNKKNRKYNYITMVIQFVFILFTFSRGVLFPIVVIVFMLIFQYRRYKKAIIALFFVLILLYILLSTGISNYILTNVIRISDFDSGRQIIWSYGINIIRKNFFTGIGRYTGINIAQLNGMEKSEFHNIFIELLVSGGVLELSFIFLLILSVYKELITKCPDKNYIKIFNIAFLVFAIRGTIESISIFSMGYSDTLFTIFYITLPLLASNMRLEYDSTIDVNIY